jgi:hypothetical protein
MSNGDAYDVWAVDAGVLARVGQALFAQETQLSVLLPTELADAAAAAWEREEDAEQAVAESVEQANVRRAAGTLALIGLAVTQSGRRTDEGVIVDLDAWWIGHALDVAERADLLEPDGDTAP